MKTLKITQVRSQMASMLEHRGTLRALAWARWAVELNVRRARSSPVC